MKRLLYSALFGCLNLSLFIGCAQAPKKEKAPWAYIQNRDARQKYVLIQQTASHMTYEKLYENMKWLSELYPNEDIITITRAGIYGDYGQTFDTETESQYKQQAVKILEPYINRSYTDKASQLRILAYNQYYYHSGQYEKLYKFGKETVGQGGLGGEVMIAVGAAMHAVDLDQKNDIFNARITALESRLMWERMYDMRDPEVRQAAYENTYYVSSLALTGECFQAQNIFDQSIKTMDRYKEMPRWFNQFDPSLLNNCKSAIQLTKQ